MGPALLPTPLSPARGRCGLAFCPDKPSFPLYRLRTWRPVSVPRPAVGSVDGLATVTFTHRLVSRFVTGARTGIRPCFVTGSL